MASEQKRKTYSMKKIIISENISIQKKIDSLFNNPKTYFTKDHEGHEIIIGKKQKFPRYNENGVLLPYCYVGELAKPVKKGNNSIINESKINQSFRTFYLQNPKKRGSGNKNYHVINDYQLGDLFDGYKKRIQSNKKGHNRFISEIPRIKPIAIQRLLLQEKVLGDKEKKDDLNQKLKETIASKVNKQINSLLMGAVTNNSYRIKQETIEATNIKNHRCNLSDWITSLRDEFAVHGKKYCYFKGRNDSSPIYGLEVYHLTDENEFVRDPENDYIESIKSNEYLRTSNGFNKFLTTTRGFHNLSVKGRNLLQLEFENAKTIKGNKRLFKRNEEDNQKQESNYFEDWK